MGAFMTSLAVSRLCWPLQTAPRLEVIGLRTKSWEIPEAPGPGHGKIMGNHGKMMGKWWENQWIKIEVPAESSSKVSILSIMREIWNIYELCRYNFHSDLVWKLRENHWSFPWFNGAWLENHGKLRVKRIYGEFELGFIQPNKMS